MPVYGFTNKQTTMKLKTLILAAIGLVVTAAVVLYSIGHYARSQTEANKGLYDACSCGNAAAAAYWLAKGADVNAPDWGHQGIPGETPLMMCAHLDADIVEMLLLLGADPNAVDQKGLPVIHRVQDGYVIDKMLLYGLDLNKTNKEGLTAVQYREKNHYIMDERLKTSLEGKGPNSKMLEESKRKFEEAKRAFEAKNAAGEKK
jgi:hypothetical protein